MRLFKFSVIALLFSSCIPNERLIYLQNQEGKNAIPEDKIITHDIPDYRLQYNDIIEVKIQTTEDLLKNGFNLEGNQLQNQAAFQMAQNGGDLYYMTGFTIDRDGNIRLPVIGAVQVRDKTLEEARLMIEEKLRNFVTSELYVRVKLGGIRFSALGEFRRPGKYVMIQERATILEAIAQAGDLTTIARRNKVLLIRQYPEGTKLHNIDLTDRSLVTSPYYFIQPNDQLYAEPLKVREVGAGENAAQSLSLLISSITAIALVLNLITR
jgi:polysaccharide export outer membrane protein